MIVPLPSASGLLVNGSGCLLMHATRETTGTTPATYRLFDGSGTGGELLLPVSLTAGQSTRDFVRRCVLPFRQGLFFQIVSGAVEGSVSVLVDHRCHDYWAQIEQQLISLTRPAPSVAV